MDSGYVQEHGAPVGPQTGEIAGTAYYQSHGPPPQIGYAGYGPPQFAPPMMQQSVRPLQQANSIGSSSNPSSHAPTPAPGQQPLSHSPSAQSQQMYYPPQGPPPSYVAYSQHGKPPPQGYYHGPPPIMQGHPQGYVQTQPMQGPPHGLVQRMPTVSHQQQPRMQGNGMTRPRGGYNNENGRGGYVSGSGQPGFHQQNSRYYNPGNGGQRGGRGNGRGGRGGRKSGRNDYKPEYSKPPSNPSPESVSHQSLPDFSEPPPALPPSQMIQHYQHSVPQHAAVNPMFQMTQGPQQIHSVYPSQSPVILQCPQGYPPQQPPQYVVAPNTGHIEVYVNPDGKKQFYHVIPKHPSGYPQIMQPVQYQMFPSNVPPQQYEVPPQTQYVVNASQPSSESFNLAAMAQALQEVSEEERQKHQGGGVPAAVAVIGAPETVNDENDYTPPGTPQELNPLNNEQLDFIASTLEGVASGLVEPVAKKNDELDESVTPPAEPVITKKRQPKPDQERYQPPARAGRVLSGAKGFGRQPVATTTSGPSESSGVWRSKSHLTKISEEEQKSTPPVSSHQDTRADSPTDVTPRASPTPSTHQNAAPKPAVPMIGGVPLIIAASKDKNGSANVALKVATKEYCAYCAMLQKPMSTVTNHSLMSATRGLPACPTFRENGCKLCGAKGDSAHLPDFCKHSRTANKENPEFTALANHVFSMGTEERRSCVIKDFGHHPTVARIADASAADEHFALVSSQSLKRVFAKQLQFNSDDLRFAQANPHYYDQPQHRSGYDSGFNRSNRGGNRGYSGGGSGRGGGSGGGYRGGSNSGGGGGTHGGYNPRSSTRSNASGRYGDNIGGSGGPRRGASNRGGSRY